MLNFNDYQNRLKGNGEKNPLIIFGAGTIGKLTLEALKIKNVQVNFFCDSDIRKHNQEIENIKIILPNDLDKLNKNTDILISANYFSSIVPLLKNKGFQYLYKSTELLENLDIEKFYKKVVIKGNGHLEPLKIKREIDFYNEMGRKDDYVINDQLNIKTIDIQVTEKCSLKCKDCSNLMQYYKKPKDSELGLLFKCTDKIMSAVDRLEEFRVLGGDPFMNKELYKIINKLVSYDKCKKVIVYTNARFVPKGDNLNCLKNKKVILDITNYGVTSPATSKFIEVAKKENIACTSFRCTTWQDCGRIMPFSNKGEKELEHLFKNCCNSDLISLLHGKLYRCPFSANGVNLKAIPQNDSDEVNLMNDKLTNKELRNQIKKLCYDKKYLTACSYCNGRDYASVNIPSAVQTKTPLEYKLADNFSVNK